MYNSSTNEWSRLHCGLILRYDEDNDALRGFSTRVCRGYDIPVSEYPDLLWCQARLNNLFVVENLSFDICEDWMWNGGRTSIGDNDPDEVFSQYTVSKYEEGNWGFGVQGSSWDGRSSIVPLVPPAVYKFICICRPGKTWLFITRFLLMIICYFREDHQLMMLYEKCKWHKFDRRILGPIHLQQVYWARGLYIQVRSAVGCMRLSGSEMKRVKAVRKVSFWSEAGGPDC